jgi:hypothetical protein
MSSARLEVIKDDAETPARMSRSMPAALDGLLTQTALDYFCDTIDELLVLSHARTQAEFKSIMERGCCFLVACLFFPVVPLCIIVPTRYLFDTLSPTGSQFLRIGLYIASFVYFVIVWKCTQPGPDAKSNKEILQLIRFECDEMTRRTPFVSFHVAAGAINHIDVSISLSAPAFGVVTTSNAILDTNNPKIDESSSNHQPVGYCAQTLTTTTATNNVYQQMNDMV